MKINLNRKIPEVLFALLLTPVLFMSSGFKQTGYDRIDTAKIDGIPREVLTSQQMYTVEVTPIKKGKYKNKRVNFRAELRDVFQVYRYAKDTSILELDWVLCPDGKCPEAKYYEPGTAEYAQLDVLIKNAKAALSKQERARKKSAK
ncbi:hypothetical protein LT679_07645 [Mucilaginibacter roseus]|uniref:Uncharacterized protein n=1 Tax=Mucilaginibacter roseus TaxID=1528868 RepID=A0ABS8U036_9SPHI|nr:hypothetical protein [Mucilaginibacter roseus]MCD8740471.1 hypothetical protein [Mucilaginibacter roseus]